MSDKICYRCHSSHVTKNGITAKGYQRYRCRDCGHSFHCESEYVGTSKREQSSSSSFSSGSRSSFSGVSSYRSTPTISSAPQQPAPAELGRASQKSEKDKKRTDIVKWLFAGLGAVIALILFSSGFLKGLTVVLSAFIISPVFDKIVSSKVTISTKWRALLTASEFIISFIVFLIGVVI